MNKFDLYLFDLDGTVLDSKEDIALAVNYALKKVNLKERTSQEIVKYVGYGAKKLIDDLLYGYPENVKGEVLGYFREFYTKNPVVKSVLYPNVKEIFYRIWKENRRIGIVTNKYEEISRKILRHFGIDSQIDILVGGDTTDERKPSPKPILYAIEKLSANPEKTVLIGDSETDITSGKNAKIFSCLVLHGYGNKKAAIDLNPDFVIKDFNNFEVLL